MENMTIKRILTNPHFTASNIQISIWLKSKNKHPKLVIVIVNILKHLNSLEPETLTSCPLVLLLNKVSRTIGGEKEKKFSA